MRATGQPKGRRELQFIPEGIADAREKPREVWIELHVVLAPHRKLRLRRVRIRAAAPGIPRPDMMRINRVQVPLELLARELAQIAREISVDIVRVVLLFDERTVDKNTIGANLPELPDHDVQVVDQLTSPGRIPVFRSDAYARYEVGLPKLGQG